jgi:formate hydrogenlyase subunit 6/NADH:ubiquinone oxidoreductase subunit I
VKLNFNLSSCVRASAVSSNCQKCVTICPTQTIIISNNTPSFTPDECIACGGCVGICPTSSFSLSTFDTTGFIFDQFQNNNILSCRQNTPCLTTFNAEALITLALGCDKSIILDTGHCQTCEIAKNLYPQIKNNINEANYILSSFSQKKVEEQELKLINENSQDREQNNNRRDFFSNFKPINLVKTKIAFEEKIDGDEAKRFEFDESIIDQIKIKKIPDSRKLFFTLFKNQNKPRIYETLDGDEISFISQKYIDDSCTNCQMCYRICPTEALSSDANHSIINFNSMLCLKCHLCHDVCSTNSIHVQKAFDIKEFFEPTKKVLAHFDIKRCHECNNAFTYFGGEIICPRCQSEEDEAIILHKINNKD